ncbi:hypothetical protein BD626DRAFT_486562 [Schizophyllum amplum]|uniref:DUF6534 domain-containing protein n=1 Tax=Schizophyllum amplum TaxID=97359 RepID=A0A550CMK7_9AGAR|nr:hypothetical protein BD626DRAFT_486562 [Auriculariopsis ampla]
MSTLNPAEVAHGPMLLGTFFNILLYGISITQTYIYWNTYRLKDRMLIRCFVLFLFLGDTLHTIFTMAYMYISLIKHFGDNEYLATATWIFSTDPALAGIIGGSVQMFFAWRVKLLTGNIWLALIIATFSVATVLCGIATAIGCGIVMYFVDFQKFSVVVIIWLAGSALSDILITGSLVYHLRHHKTGFKSTDSRVDKIIRLTVQTGLITCVWALADLLVYLLDAVPWHLMLNFPLSKLYTNSLMSSLNSRKGWNYSDSNQDTSQHVSTGERVTRRDVVNLSATRPEVFVQVESHEMVDQTDTKRAFSDTYAVDDTRGGWQDSVQKKSMGAA